MTRIVRRSATEQVLNVMDPEFGVKGDGTPEGAAIQNVLNVANSRCGKVFFPRPPVKYVTDQPLNPLNNTEIFGAHRFSTIIEPSGAFAVFSPGGPDDVADRRDRLTIRSLRLRGAGVGTYGIDAENCKRWSIRDLWIDGFTEAGLRTSKSWDLEMSNSTFSGNPIGALFGASSNSMSLSSCYFDNATDAGMIIDGTNGSSGGIGMIGCQWNANFGPGLRLIGNVYGLDGIGCYFENNARTTQDAHIQLNIGNVGTRGVRGVSIRGQFSHDNIDANGFMIDIGKAEDIKLGGTIIVIGAQAGGRIRTTAGQTGAVIIDGLSDFAGRPDTDAAGTIA